MLIPGNISLNGAESHKPCRVEPLCPQVRIYAEVVDGAGNDAERLAGQEEVTVTDGGVCKEASYDERRAEE